jgi:hypothetical protein
MTTIHGEMGKTIQFAFSNVIHECNRHSYIVELPTVICSNKKDAERIQEDVGAFISALSKKLIEE